jgi:methylated-DNA-[protein]-cysteine S-methyltransferase
MDSVIHIFSIAWGWLGAAAGSQGLLATTLPRNSRQEVLDVLLRQYPRAQEGSTPLLKDLRAKLERYFLGQRVSFSDQPLDTAGATDFQSRVWEVVRNIPFGETRTYGWVAVRVSSPLAARAVGRAMALNPLPIIIPCHRIVGHNGQLTGFGGGVAMKRRLLDMESEAGNLTQGCLPDFDVGRITC